MSTPRRPRSRPRSTGCARKGVKTIIVIGHDGATAGTLTQPDRAAASTSPTRSTDVDAVIGDHTDFQVLTDRPNGTLVTENLSKGLRFTRVRLVLDTTTKAVVYKTADFHKPWDIGVTPDPAIQARIDELNAELTPDPRHRRSASRRVAIPRSDVCGRPTGGTLRVARRRRDRRTPCAKYRTAPTSRSPTPAVCATDLTCPAGGRHGFCPAFTPAPYPITRGQVLAVLPFGNVVGDAARSTAPS